MSRGRLFNLIGGGCFGLAALLELVVYMQGIAYRPATDHLFFILLILTYVAVCVGLCVDVPVVFLIGYGMGLVAQIVSMGVFIASWGGYYYSWSPLYLIGHIILILFWVMMILDYSLAKIGFIFGYVAAGLAFIRIMLYLIANGNFYGIVGTFSVLILLIMAISAALVATGELLDRLRYSKHNRPNNYSNYGGMNQNYSNFSNNNNFYNNNNNNNNFRF